jgi:hypothetical protein
MVPPAPADGYVLFVATSSGYELLERDGAAPTLGEQVELAELDGAPATLTALRISPLPGDERPCLVCIVDGRRAPQSDED